jgi:DNA repair protein RadA/Sms
MSASKSDGDVLSSLEKAFLYAYLSRPPEQRSVAEACQELGMDENDGTKILGRDYVQEYVRLGIGEIKKKLLPQPSVLGLKLIRGDEIADVEQRWLVPGFLPDATLSIMAGLPGIGKTTVSLSIAASITRGEIPIVDGTRPLGNVFMLSNEDSPSHIRSSFERLGGDLSRFFVESNEDMPWLLDDTVSLENALLDYKPSLAIIDSFFSHAPLKVDVHKHAEVAPPLIRLRQIAEAAGCAVILIHHANKSTSDQPLLKISASIGISAVARHVLFIGAHPDDETLRVVGIAKSNIAKVGAPSMVLRLDPFGWIGPSTVRAADLLQPTAAPDRRIDEAIEFLRRELGNGSRGATDVHAAATTAGISERTLRRARERLGIQPRKSIAGRWIWSLPEVGHEDGRLKNMDCLDNLDTFNKTKHLLTTSIVSPDEDVQKSERGHVDGHVEGQGRKKQNLKDMPDLISIIKGGVNPSPTPARFSLDEALDLIQTTAVNRQARATVKTAFEAAIPDVVVFRKINPEAASTWLMGRCCTYFETVRATWPQDQWRYAKKPADFLASGTWREEPIIWDRSQQPAKEQEYGNPRTKHERSYEDLQRVVAAERARANASNEPDGVLEPVSDSDGSNAERGSVSSLFPNRSQLVPNGHRSGIRPVGTLAKILNKRPRI